MSFSHWLNFRFLDEQKKYQDQGQREEKEDRLDSFFKEIKIEGIYIYYDTNFCTKVQFFNGLPPSIVKFGKLNPNFKEIFFFDQPWNRGMAF